MSLSAAIPTGSLILVTGANGYIASHIVDQLLQLDYRVRGTSRTATKLEWLKARSDVKYGKDKFEIAVVKDMAEPGAFDQAVEGVSGVCHVASILPFSGTGDPNSVIPTVISGALNAATAAAAHKGITRFVYTSSSTAISAPKPDVVFDFSTEIWNEEQVAEAWTPPPYTPERAWAVYGASKTQAEQAMWKFVREQQPGFVLNTVLPNANMGDIFDAERQGGSTHQWVGQVYRGEWDKLEGVPPQWMVNVKDNARVHVAALLEKGVQGERILAFGWPFNWNDILKVLRGIFPDKKLPEDREDDSRDLSKVDNRRGAELLRLFGRDGWTGLEETVRENTVGLA